jgi:hypothetical protein
MLLGAGFGPAAREHIAELGAFGGVNSAENILEPWESVNQPI